MEIRTRPVTTKQAIAYIRILSPTTTISIPEGFAGYVCDLDLEFQLQQSICMYVRSTHKNILMERLTNPRFQI